MPKTRRSSRIVNNDEVNKQVLCAISTGNLVSLKKLVDTHGLSYCEEWRDGYLLLCVAIDTGHIAVAKFLLKKGAKTEDKNSGRANTPLHLAVHQGSVELVGQLLMKNAPVNATNCKNETPLHFAADDGHVEIVKELLKHNANVMAQTEEGSTPLLLAVEVLHEEIVSMLVRHGSRRRSGRLSSSTPLPDIPKIGVSRKDENYNARLLNTAVREGHTEIVKLLLQSEFDANATNEAGKPPICYALTCEEEDKCVEIIKMLMASGANIKEAPELLHNAVTEGFMKVCKILIENGVNVNELSSSGETPLYLSCDWAHGNKSRQKKDNIVKLLLMSGADVNMKLRNGRTAFHRAVMNGRKTAVCLFLENRVDVDQRAEDDRTPLHFASEYDGEEMVEILLKNGANVHARQRDGWTPLHRAVCSNSPCSKVVEKLLEFGADIDACGAENKTALHCIISAGSNRWCNEVVKILVDDGCDVNVETSDGKTAIDLGIERWGHDNFLLEPVLKTLAMHLFKLKEADLHISAKNNSVLKHLVDTFSLEDAFFSEVKKFRVEHRREVERMKSERFSSHVTLHGLLSISEKIARNTALMHSLKRFNFKRFPLYKSIILGKLRRSESRLALQEAGQMMLDLLFERSCKSNGSKYSVFPTELLEMIVSYLSPSELKCLISCGETLKCQLKALS